MRRTLEYGRYDGVYLSYLPRGFSIGRESLFPSPGTGDPRGGPLYADLARNRHLLQRMAAYHPDRTDNEVVRLDLASSGFLRLLRTLRVVLLQDSVILRQQFPLHPLWTDPLFNGEEYRRFVARVEGSLVDVVTPNELAM